MTWCTAVYFDRPQDMALKLSGKEISCHICLMISPSYR